MPDLYATCSIYQHRNTPITCPSLLYSKHEPSTVAILKNTDTTIHSVTLEGIGDVVYAVAGSGPPVVLLHGLGGSMVTWAPTISCLAKSHTVFIPDLPGHGQSVKPPSHYNLDFGIHFANAFLDSLQLSEVSLIGNSLGGLIALATALRNPKVVKSLVLVDPAGLGRQIAWSLRLASIPVVGPVLAKLDAQVGPGLLKRIFFEPSRVDADIAREIVRLVGDPQIRHTILRSLKSNVSVFGLHRTLLQDNQARNLLTPTLLIWGQEDRVIPVQHGIDFAHSHSNVQIHVIQNCGHLPQLEQVEEFNRVVAHFLTTL